MQARSKMIVAAVAGLSVGSLAVQALHAQSKPPAYIVIEVAEGQSANSARDTAALQSMLKPHGGRYIVRTDDVEPLDGTSPKRSIIYQFDSIEQATAYWNSPEQKKANETRIAGTKSHAFMVNGL